MKRQKFRVTVEVYVGQHDFEVEVLAKDEWEAKETASSKVLDELTWDDFGSSMTVMATRCEPVRARRIGRRMRCPSTTRG